MKPLYVNGGPRTNSCSRSTIPSKPEQIADAYRRSLDNGFVPYVGDRSLGRLRINPGFEPSRTPDEYEYITD